MHSNESGAVNISLRWLNKSIISYKDDIEMCTELFLLHEQDCHEQRGQLFCHLLEGVSQRFLWVYDTVVLSFCLYTWYPSLIPLLCIFELYNCHSRINFILFNCKSLFKVSCFSWLELCFQWHTVKFWEDTLNGKSKLFLNKL